MSDGNNWPAEQPKPSKLSVASLALGVFGVFTFWMFPFWLSMAAIATGLMALSGVKNQGKGGYPQARAGVISGFIGIALSISLALWAYLFVLGK